MTRPGIPVCRYVIAILSVCWNILVAADTGLHAGDDLQRFVSRPDLRPPKWNITYHKKDRIAPGYWFVAPYRFADNYLDDVKWTPCEVGPMIFDNDGELVWSGACQFSNRIAFDFGMTELRGEKVLKGNLKNSDFPDPNCGAGWFLNNQYNVEHSVSLAKDIDKFNQHEFNVHADGRRTTIITHGRMKLDVAACDLEGKVWTRTDGFRDLITETGDIVFDWRTQDHVSLNESSFQNPCDADGPKLGDFSRSHSWDAFHVNSASKNADGDYLVSVRHLDTLLLVSGKDGHIIWRCGGKLSDFAFEENAIFSRQHDARYLQHDSDRSIISLMDNAIGDMEHDSQPPTHHSSRGLVLELTHKQGEPYTVRRLKQYIRPDGGYADRRGSLQILPNTNVFMAWTDAGYLSEHSADDEVLMEARWYNEERFGTYRGYKFDGWVGKPDSKPDIKAMGYGFKKANTIIVAVSWNGATEVRRWKFFAGDQLLEEVNRTGFETTLAATNTTVPVWAEAVDAKGKSLGKSAKVQIEWTDGLLVSQDTGMADDIWGTATAHPFFTSAVFVLNIAGCVAMYQLLRAAISLWKHEYPWHRTGGSYKEVPLEDAAPS